MTKKNLSVAVIVPCYNEELTVGNVIKRFRLTLPFAAIYVYDNNSRDRTVEVARAAGARVMSEPRQGKGNVVRRMFRDVEADVYILVDGDNTYDAEASQQMLHILIEQELDMVVGCRVTESAGAYRLGHRFGNQLFTNLIAWIFGRQTRDILSGFRVFSRRFVKSFPALSLGFEIETELTVHALELNMPIGDFDTNYGDRPQGSQSKLNTVGDGLRIIRMILLLVKQERPLLFFGLATVLLALLSFALAYPVLLDYIATGLVPRLPTAILATAIMLLAFLSLACGLILDTVTHGRREMKRLAYLSLSGVAVLKSDDKIMKLRA